MDEWYDEWGLDQDKYEDDTEDIDFVPISTLKDYEFVKSIEEKLCWMILDADPSDFDRHRSISIDYRNQEDEAFEKPMICWYGRIGGDNREDHEECIEEIRSHPYYCYDQDSDYDETYALFYFKLPPGALRWYNEQLRIYNCSKRTALEAQTKAEIKTENKTQDLYVEQKEIETKVDIETKTNINIEPNTKTEIVTKVEIETNTNINPHQPKSTEARKEESKPVFVPSIGICSSKVSGFYEQRLCWTILGSDPSKLNYIRYCESYDYVCMTKENEQGPEPMICWVGKFSRKERKYYKDTIEELRSHPYYSHDNNNSYDGLYSLFYFKLPPGALEWFNKQMKFYNELDMQKSDNKITFAPTIHVSCDYTCFSFEDKLYWTILGIHPQEIYSSRNYTSPYLVGTMRTSKLGEYMICLPKQPGFYRRNWACPIFLRLQSHPYYSHNDDDSYDNRIASFYFKLPPGALEWFNQQVEIRNRKLRFPKSKESKSKSKEQITLPSFSPSSSDSNNTLNVTKVLTSSSEEQKKEKQIFVPAKNLSEFGDLNEKFKEKLCAAILDLDLDLSEYPYYESIKITEVSSTSYHEPVIRHRTEVVGSVRPLYYNSVVPKLRKHPYYLHDTCTGYYYFDFYFKFPPGALDWYKEQIDIQKKKKEEEARSVKTLTKKKEMKKKVEQNNKKKKRKPKTVVSKEKLLLSSSSSSLASSVTVTVPDTPVVFYCSRCSVPYNKTTHAIGIYQPCCHSACKQCVIKLTQENSTMNLFPCHTCSKIVSNVVYSFL